MRIGFAALINRANDQWRSHILTGLTAIVTVHLFIISPLGEDYFLIKPINVILMVMLAAGLLVLARSIISASLLLLFLFLLVTAFVIEIHGGPEGQSRPGYSAWTQYLVNELGYAVLQPNVRGSTGYGRTFTMLDNGRLREDSVRDIGALLVWISAQPGLDAGRVVVSGGSYGGYMVLASMVAFGDRLRGGIDIVGISNFVTFLTNTAPYRRDLRRVEYGDERDPAMRRFLQRISPLTRAEAIRKPLLVIQGLNDPRVPASESEQMVARVRANGAEVWYLAARDEGHGFRKKSNRDFELKTRATFLERLKE